MPIGKCSTDFDTDSTATTIKTLFYSEQRFLLCSVQQDEEHGESDAFAPVPVVTSAAGVEDMIELELTEKKPLSPLL